MASNREISRLFNLYAELLLLHNKNEDLSKQLSGSAYRLRNMDEVGGLPKDELAKLFRPRIIRFIEELNISGTIEELDELIQLTPAGLFEMMRIRGLGGKKLSILWKTAKIDTLEGLLSAAKNNELTNIPGFGLKTQQNIVYNIEAYTGNKDRFHYASVADLASMIVKALQTVLKTKLISLCGEIRRQATTVPGIEILGAIKPKELAVSAIRKFLII